MSTDRYGRLGAAARRRARPARALGAGGAGRADPGDEHPAGLGRDPRAVHAAGRGVAVEGGRQHAPGLGARARDRDRRRRPRRAADRLEPLGVPGVPRADRVPAADPLGGADPARGADLRHRPREQGLPRRVRVVLAAADPDDLRRPGRRPRGDRHRARVRARAVRADVARHGPERGALHRHRHPHLLRGRADPGGHRRAGDRLGRARAGDQQRRAPAATSTSCTPSSSPPACSAGRSTWPPRRSRSGCCTGIPRSGARSRERPHAQAARAGGRDHGADRAASR